MLSSAGRLSTHNTRHMDRRNLRGLRDRLFLQGCTCGKDDSIMTEQSLPFEADNGPSQCAQLLAAFRQGRRLTCLDILREFQCMNGKGRIHELRKAGHEIKDEWVITPSRKRVKSYYL